MNTNLIAGVLLAYSGAWPTPPLTDAQTEMWYRALATEPPAYALEAVDQLAKTVLDWPPSIARYCETRRALDPASRTREFEAPALPSGERIASADTNAAWLAKIRADLPRLTKRVP